MTVVPCIRIRPAIIAEHPNIKDRRFRDTALRHVTKGSRTLPGIPRRQPRARSQLRVLPEHLPAPESANIAAMPGVLPKRGNAAFAGSSSVVLLRAISRAEGPGR